MKNLNQKRNNNILVFFMLLTGCSTSSFQVKNETDALTELFVSPSRILLECEELDEDPDIGAYGFMVHILDEKNTVTTSALSTRHDKKNCERHIRKITGILKNGKKIYIGNRNSLTDQPRRNDGSRMHYNFPAHGTFFSNGRSLDFVFIANEKGQCYGPLYRTDEACPKYPFPIKK